MTTYSWRGTSGASWNDKDEWVDLDDNTAPAGPPGAGDIVEVPANNHPLGDDAQENIIIATQGEQVGTLYGASMGYFPVIGPQGDEYIGDFPSFTTLQGGLSADDLYGVKLDGGDYNVKGNAGSSNPDNALGFQNFSDEFMVGTMGSATGAWEFGESEVELVAGTLTVGGSFAGVVDDGVASCDSFLGGEVHGGTVTANTAIAPEVYGGSLTVDDDVTGGAFVYGGTLTAGSLSGVVQVGLVGGGSVIDNGALTLSPGWSEIEDDGLLTVAGAAQVTSTVLTVGVDPGGGTLKLDDGLTISGTVAKANGVPYFTGLQDGDPEGPGLGGSVTVTGLTTVDLNVDQSGSGIVIDGDDAQATFLGSVELGEIAFGNFEVDAGTAKIIDAGKTGLEAGAGTVAVDATNSAPSTLTVDGNTVIADRVNQTSSFAISGKKASAILDGSLTVGQKNAVGSVTVSKDGSLTVDDEMVTLNGATLTVESGAEAAIDASGETDDELLIGSKGEIVGTGRILSTVTGTVQIQNTDVNKYSLNVENQGTIEAKSGQTPAAFSLVVDGNVTGDGKMLIDANSSLEIGGGVGQNQTVTFQSDGTGQLILDDPWQFQGTIAGMAIDDQIILKNMNPDSGNGVNDVTIGTLESGVNLELLEGPPNQFSPYEQFILMDLSIELDPPDEFFNVTQSGDDTVLTLTKGNPIAQSIGAQNGQGQPTTSETGAGVSIGVISYGDELTAMKDIIEEIAPGAAIVALSAAPGDIASLTKDVKAMQSLGINVVVDDLGPGVPGLFDPFGQGWGGDSAASAIGNIVQAGVTYVTSAGNNNKGDAALPVLGHNAAVSAITVAAMNWLATPPGDSVGGYITPSNTEFFSRMGKVDVTGPDAGPTSLGLDSLNPFFGTSAAAPAVAAVVALMMEKDFQLESAPILVEQILRKTAVNVNGNIFSQGAGLVQAEAAVAATPDPTSFDPSPEPGLSVSSAALSQPAGDADTGSTLGLRLTMNEGVTVTGVPTFELNDGGVATYDAALSDPSAGVVMFDYTVDAGQQTANLEVTSLDDTGATVTDSGGSSANFAGLFDEPTGVSINSPLAVESVTSSQSGEIQAAQSTQLTLKLNQDVTLDTGGGAPTLSLSNGASATYDAPASSPSTGALVFNYTVGADDDPTPNLSILSVNLPTGTTVRDTDGANADFAAALNQDVGLQVGAAFVDSFSTSETEAARAGQTTQLTLVISDPVVVDTAGGSPTLTLNDGATATYSAAASNPATGTLVFDYDVGSQDQTPDLEITKFNPNGATIDDGNGVGVDFSEAIDFPIGLTVNSPLAVKSVTSSQSGTSAVFTLTMSEGFTVDIDDGIAPTLIMSDGTTATYDADDSLPTGDTLAFDDTLAVGEKASTLQIDAVELYGGSVTDAAGNNADFSGASPATLALTNAAELPDSAKQTLNGTIDAADAGLTIKIYDGATLVGSTTANGSGFWSAAVTLAGALAGSPHVLTAQATKATGAAAVSNAQVLAAGGGESIELTGGAGDAASLYDTGGGWDSLNGYGGTVYLTGAQAAVTGGGDTIDFAGGSGNAASLYGAGGAWDSVNGSGGTIYLIGAQAVVTGGGDTVNFRGGPGNAVTVAGSGGDWDSVNGLGGTVYLISGQAEVNGGGDTVDFVSGSGNAVTVADTSGDWDSVNGSAGTVYLTGGQAVVSGETDTIDFINGSGDAATVAGSAEHFDIVNGSNGTIYLTGGQAVVTGGGDTVDFVSGSGDAVTVAGASGYWDSVNGSNGTVYLTSGRAVVTGGGDTVDFISGSGNAATLANSGGNWDSVNGSGGTVYLESGQAQVNGGGDNVDFVSGSGNAVTIASGGNWDQVNGFGGMVYLVSGQAQVNGGGDTVNFVSGSGNAVTIANSGDNWDQVNGSSGTVYLSSGQAAVTGGGNTMRFVGGSENAVSLYATDGAWDGVTGSNGSVYLFSAQAGVAGSGDTINMSGTSSVTQAGASDTFVFQAAIGVETINGYAASDSFQFSKTDFANFAALQPHISQSGGNTVISLDANDTVTLTGVTTPLTSTQFHFV